MVLKNKPQPKGNCFISCTFTSPSNCAIEGKQGEAGTGLLHSPHSPLPTILSLTQAQKQKLTGLRLVSIYGLSCACDFWELVLSCQPALFQPLGWGIRNKAREKNRPQASFKVLYPYFLSKDQSSKNAVCPAGKGHQHGQKDLWGSFALIPETSVLAVLFLKVGGEVRGSKQLSLELATAN